MRRPSSFSIREPTQAARVRQAAPYASVSQAGAGIVSLSRSATHSVSAAAMASLYARAKPRLRRLATMPTSGKRRRTSSTEPSDDPLSMQTSRADTPSRSRRRHASRQRVTRSLRSRFRIRTVMGAGIGALGRPLAGPLVVDVADALVVVPLRDLELAHAVPVLVHDAVGLPEQAHEQVVRAALQRQVLERQLERAAGDRLVAVERAGGGAHQPDRKSKRPHPMHIPF